MSAWGGTKGKIQGVLTGAGAGMALVMVFCGLGMSAVGLSGYGVRVIREAEIILPDHEVTVEPESDLNQQL
jgi:hypothetical protein